MFTQQQYDQILQLLRKESDEVAVNAADQDVNLAHHGTRIILPSTHAGSSRHMYQLFQDSMAICRRYRKPDIFLTMTANP